MKTLNIPILSGRAFSEDFGAEQSKIIFNETAISRMGLVDPIGQTIKRGRRSFQIIGVVKDFHFESLYEEIKPCFFTLTSHGDNIMVKIVGGEQQSALESDS